MLELKRLINASLQVPHPPHPHLAPLHRTHRLNPQAQKEHRLRQFMKLIRDPLKEARRIENYEEREEGKEERDRREQNTLSFHRNWRPALGSEVTIEGQGLREVQRKARRLKTEMDSSLELPPSNQLVLKFPQLSLVKQALHIQESKMQSKQQLSIHAKLPPRKKQPCQLDTLIPQAKPKRQSLNHSAVGASWQRQTEISGWTVNDVV